MEVNLFWPKNAPSWGESVALSLCELICHSGWLSDLLWVSDVRIDSELRRCGNETWNGVNAMQSIAELFKKAIPPGGPFISLNMSICPSLPLSICFCRRLDLKPVVAACRKCRGTSLSSRDFLTGTRPIPQDRGICCLLCHSTRTCCMGLVRRSPTSTWKNQKFVSVSSYLQANEDLWLDEYRKTGCKPGRGFQS